MIFELGDHDKRKNYVNGLAGTLTDSRIAARTIADVLVPARRVDEALRDERQRIAREIHDRAGSDLAYTLQCLELYDVHSSSSPELAASQVLAARQALLRAYEAICTVTRESRSPQPLSDLKSTLRPYADHARVLGVILDVAVNGDELLLPAAVRDQITLILREAVRNALSHGQPRLVTVSVDIGTEELQAVVADDGRGFHPRCVARGGTGLTCMRERTQLVGGKIRINSRIGRGTRVELLVPIKRSDDEPS